MMVVGLFIETGVAPGGSRKAAMEAITKQALDFGLGVGADFGQQYPSQGATGGGLGDRIRALIQDKTKRSIEASRRTLTSRLRASLPGSEDSTTIFELLSAPGEFCICDAIPNDTVEPDPHPEDAPIVRFLRWLLGQPYVSAASIFFGPVWMAQTAAVVDVEIRPETADEFVERFTTLAPDRIIGLAVNGIFQIHA